MGQRAGLCQLKSETQVIRSATAILRKFLFMVASLLVVVLLLPTAAAPFIFGIGRGSFGPGPGDR